MSVKVLKFNIISRKIIKILEPCYLWQQIARKELYLNKLAFYDSKHKS